VAGILKQEDRSLHIILFGASGQLRTHAMDARNDAAGLLAFLRQGFNGGTDFETPLQHALHLVETNPGCLKADVLMVSDARASGCRIGSAMMWWCCDCPAIAAELAGHSWTTIHQVGHATGPGRNSRCKLNVNSSKCAPGRWSSTCLNPSSTGASN
jgi:hypothetical protein